MYLYIFWQNEIGKKAAHKMLAILTAFGLPNKLVGSPQNKAARSKLSVSAASVLQK